jgi:hypothetical protein
MHSQTPRITRRKGRSEKRAELFTKPLARPAHRHALWPAICWLPVVRPPRLYRQFDEQRFLTVLAGFGLG